MVMLQSCGPKVSPVELPSHQVGYAQGFLWSDEGKTRIISLENIDLSPYPHLKPKEGFVLRWAAYEFAGGDVLGFVVAIHQASDAGFAVEPLNGMQGAFLFAPIESDVAALEYVQFMAHETPESGYERDHAYIRSQADFEEALSQMREVASNDAVKILDTPPTNITRVTGQGNGSYLVELVYKCELYKQRLEYLSCLVDSDGNLGLQERYVFIEGPPGPVL